MAKDTISASTPGRGLVDRPGGGRGSDGLSVSRVRPAYQQVADQLLDRILDGSLAAGDRLPSETELSAIFGVSRSTVREALRVLTSRDLVETARGTTGGTFVRRVELGQVSDYLETSLGLMSGTDDVTVAHMLEAREILEVPAARLAAERREAYHLEAMREAVEREKISRGRGMRFKEHRNFHGVVLQSSSNALLEIVTEPVFRVLQTKFLDPDVEPRFWDDVDHDHEEILEAIADRDPERAAEAMREHLVRLRGTYRDRTHTP
ncbi:MAG: FadR/GntR family transcriptional regulator [Aeromicrobium sp.]|uniref:FadR/GntR family transcriptional regulator n=1 Tax=Aeromicrobium sp. TaxID=1871063 RepID=UPI0026187F22|nr:FadR/GntR family transcriptional regulator [Aeromicrobium sp.]MDF1704696.1 FadR/GntR family transcriptional regulator [Aeromicrobium sp.]